MRRPLKKNARGNPAKTILTIMTPKHPDRVCTNIESITIPGQAGLKHRQDFPYRSAELSASYHGPRNTVEGASRRIKSGDEQQYGESDNRLSRSLTAQAFFAATAIIASNCTRIPTA